MSDDATEAYRKGLVEGLQEEHPDADAAEFAILYSRQLRITEEYRTRLFGFLYEALPFINAANGLFEALLDTDAKKANGYMHAMMGWRADVEAAMYLNLFVPPRECGLKAAEVPNRAGKIGIEDLMNMEEFGEYLEPYATKVAEAWDEFANQTGVHKRHEAKKKYMKEAEKKARDHHEMVSKELSQEQKDQLEAFKEALQSAFRKKEDLN